MTKNWAIWCEKAKNFISTPFFPLGFFLILSIINLDLPGLYMDSVNPDYLAAYISNPDKVPAWIYPDNILFPIYKYPLLNSLYGGATPAYIGLLVWKIIGYSVFSIRILHLMFGLVLVFLCYKTINWITKNRFFASAIAIIISLDPTFLFAWRTQYYLQLFPLLTFIPSLVLLTKEILAIKKTGQFRPKILMLSGFLVGFSAWSYFIFVLYFLACLCVLIYYASKQNVIWRVLKLYCISFLAGYGLFIYAHISIILVQGFRGYIESLSAMNNAYGISQNFYVDLSERVLHVWTLLTHLFGGDLISKLMVGETPYRVFIGIIIIIVWFLFTFLILALKLKKNYYNTDLQQQLFIFTKLIIAIVFVHLLFGLLIGTSLNLQHYIMLLPMFYLSGGVSIYGLYLVSKKYLAKLSTMYYKSLKVGVIAVWLLLSITYVNYNLSIYNLLYKTGGVNYYSDSINRLAAYTYETPSDAVFAFPQWGYWMGVAAATGGNREIWSESNIEQLIFDIKNRPAKKDYFVVLDVKEADEAKNRIAKETELILNDTVTFHTRDGIPTFIVAHFERKNIEKSDN